MPVTNKAQIQRMVTMCGATLRTSSSGFWTNMENKEALFDAGMVYA